MKFEKVAFSSESREEKRIQKESELRKGALELEKKVSEIEKMERGEDRDESIREADELNSRLEELEKISGISAEEILQMYEGLSEDVAKKGLEEMLVEAGRVVGLEEEVAMRKQVEEGSFGNFLNFVKKHLPKKLCFVAACVLVISIAAPIAFDVSAAQAGDQTYYASLDSSREAPSYKEQQLNEKMKKADHILEDANGEAMRVIESVEGGLLKKIRQKAIIDNLADNHDEILNYFKGAKADLPNLANKHAAELVSVYGKAIESIREIGDQDVLRSFEGKFESIMDLIRNKDYKGIEGYFSET